jgi:hypothetical protein
MTQEHPITPPPELVEGWMAEIWHEGTPVRVAASDLHIATQAARWGADTELDACCKWLPKLPPWSADDLRRHRRPKPTSLKEQALQALYRFNDTEGHEGLTQEQISEDYVIIRRALEQLDD